MSRLQLAIWASGFLCGGLFNYCIMRAIDRIRARRENPHPYIRGGH
jgi:hypothetical protein